MNGIYATWLFHTAHIIESSHAFALSLSPFPQLSFTQTIAEAPPDFVIPAIPAIAPDAFAKRERDALKNAQIAFERIGKGVSPEGQEIFDYICKTIPCHWEGVNINVNGGDAFIVPPYKCENLSGKSETCIAHVSKMLNAVVSVNECVYKHMYSILTHYVPITATKSV